jgi:hypothetical protein
MKEIVLITFLLLNLIGFSQEKEGIVDKYTAHNKGKFFIYWGGNRDEFSNSDIHFTGANYDFTVQNTIADDKPKGWHVDYINPARMTIPQTNFKLGYYINDHYNISIGVDHMKYVMRQDQIATVSGKITYENTSITEVFNSTPKVISEDFLTFEHTDGLNYVNAEICRVDDISKVFKLKNTDKFQLNLTEGLSSGLLYPKTNTMLLGKERHDDYHVSGFGFSAKAGLNFTFFKHYFIQTDLKAGYINMPDIRTTFDPADRASQSFWFLEKIIVFGGIFRI